MAQQPCRALCAMPSELLIAIMEQMGVRDLTAFAVSSKRFFGIFKENQARLMATVLLGQPELECILFVYTIDRRDFNPEAMLHPRTISVDVSRADNRLIRLMHSPVSFQEGKLICPRKITFGLRDLTQVWNMMKIVDWWVEEYPRLRWSKNPEDRRCLRLSEERRLRKAISRWWLYAECFHGKYARSPLLPRMWQADGRLHHLRIMPTSDIRELEDLWETLQTVIGRDICSSLELDDETCKEHVMPWGYSQWRNQHIVNTYMKLDPEQLKFFLDRGSYHNRMAIVRAAKATQLHFDFDQETLSWSIETVLQERLMLKQNNVMDIPASGILDEDSYNDEEGHFTYDAWPTGKPPLTKEEVQSYPTAPTRSVPPGDDGTESTDYAYTDYNEYD